MTGLPLGAFLWIVAIGSACGLVEGRRLASRVGSLDVGRLRRQAPYLLFLVPVSLAGLAGDAVLFWFHALQWHLPLWLLVGYIPFVRGLVLAVLTFVMAMTAAIAFATGHRQRWHVVGAGVLFLTALQVAQSQLTQPVALGPARFKDGLILQSTGSTCVPATAANIARCFGIDRTEHDMVLLCGTTAEGTSPAGAVYGMNQLGIEARIVEVADLREVHPPAMLFVNHRSLGMEAHAIAFVGFRDGQAEIWDPSRGRRFQSLQNLRAIWPGHAIEFTRTH